MDVTRKNFKEAFPIVSSAIDEASFVAIDGEFTGLSGSGCKINGMDLPDERYHKLRKSVSELLLVQYGICTFKWDEDKDRYITKAFNFYIFPKPFNYQAKDRRFMCQSSSMDFLASCNFDFNKVFRDGISYMTVPEKDRLANNLEEKHRAANQMSSSVPSSPAGGKDLSTPTRGPPDIPDNHKPVIESICKDISHFIETEEEELVLKSHNAFVRKLLYQTTKHRFGSQILLETRYDEHNNRFQVVTRIQSEAHMKEKVQQRQQKEIADLEDAVGFSKVIKALSQSGKLVVGHNMILDLLYTISQFLYPLPEDYEEFKSLVQCSFPRIVDTKHVATSDPFKEHIMSTALAELQRRLLEEPFNKRAPTVVTAEGFPNYTTDSERLHEAGYDAYITGLSYATMLKHHGDNLDKFLNKLHLMRLYEIPYMNLAGKDISPNRDNVFFVTFPLTWRSSDLVMLFSAFGNININWIDESSAFIALNRKDAAPQVLRQLKSSTVYKVISYKQYRAIQSQVREENSCKKAVTVNQTSSPANQRQSNTVIDRRISPIQTIVGNKRKLPISDVGVPERRRSRELNESTANDSRNSNFSTILEDMEFEKEGIDPMSQPPVVASPLATEDLGVAIPRKRAKLDISGNKGKTPTTSTLNDSRVSNFSTIPEDCEMEESGKSGDDPDHTPQRVNQHRRFDSSGAGEFDVPDTW